MDAADQAGASCGTKLSWLLFALSSCAELFSRLEIFMLGKLLDGEYGMHDIYEICESGQFDTEWWAEIGAGVVGAPLEIRLQ